MITKQEAYTKISELVVRFDEQIDSYKQSDYNETLTRRDFIDPFFKALGWDVDNSQGNAEAYREVIHEDRVKIGKATKAPDYSFRLPGGKRLFFVEAKKPSVAIKSDISVAYQIRRYGWSAKLPVSIITDFEELAVYDCTKRPKPTDKSGMARIKYINFREYASEFDYIWNTFSKERVLKGSFDRYIQSDTAKKGTATVDKEFLESLDKWRTYLATTISLRNKNLDEDEINYVVQLTIDRLIFLRIAEDRGVEPYGQLKVSVNQKGEAYQNLFFNFKNADAKYNSGLFDFKKDVISESLKIDNKVIKAIVKEMYYPDCPYEFSVLPVEILGNAYEQFLGKVIRITPAHHAKIEEKPEVRKAGGVYYTPQYVVDYIVENTVGKLIHGKTPRQISGIRICDPACGSGSFLIGAYQYLLGYHKDYYTDHGATTGKKNSPVTPAGELTSAEKKRILRNNIFGVDIDVNAVEVTKLSLLLKCMEGETATTISQQQKLWHERILPNLGDNIKSGNSLVDTDFYDAVIDFGEEKKIKPFNWQRAFPEVFEKGGFDAVIGNPPWVDIKGHPNELVRYYFKNYKSTENRINLYSIFVERGLNILSKKGLFGFIIPNSILYQSSYEKIRKYLLSDFNINNVVRLPDNIFQNVKAETIVLIASKQREKTECILYNRNDLIFEISKSNCKEIKIIDSDEWKKNDSSVFDIFSNEAEKRLIKKIEKDKTELVKLCDFTLGITPYDKYKGHTQEQIKGKVFHATYKKDNTFKPLLDGANVKRYLVSRGDEKYISYGDWLGAPREKRFFIKPRVLVRQIVSGKPPRIYAGYSEEELYNTQSIFNIVSKDEKVLSIKYLLALMNSNLMNFYHGHKYLDLSKNLFQKILIQNCKKFPIKTIKNKDELKIFQEIEKLVDLIIHLNEELQTTKVPSKTEQLQTRINHTDKRINQLVYELYGLTHEEIAMVEEES